MDITINKSRLLDASIQDAVVVQAPRVLQGEQTVKEALRMLAGSVRAQGVSSGLFVSQGRERFWLSATDFAIHLATNPSEALSERLDRLDLRRTENPLRKGSPFRELLARFRRTNSLTVYLCSPTGRAEGFVVAKDVLATLVDSIDDSLTVRQFARVEDAVQCTVEDDWTLAVPEGEPGEVYAHYQGFLRRFLREGKRFAVQLNADGGIEMGASLARTVLAMSHFEPDGDLNLTGHLTNVPTATLDQPLKSLVRTMIEGPHMWSPVTDGDGNYAGIVQALTIVNACKFE